MFYQKDGRHRLLCILISTHRSQAKVVGLTAGEIAEGLLNNLPAQEDP